MMDPTYNKELIESTLLWHIAFILSEMSNDDAPIGWSKYIPTAKVILENFDVRPKKS
jgi:hypothetical protein